MKAASILLAGLIAAAPGLASDGAGHWAFQPLIEPAVPEPRDSAWARGELDRFIRHALEIRGWSPADEADRLTWMRRVSLDLVGLPPTPEEMDAYLRDDRPGAEERVVNALLESPRHGERWAQHWLDLVRYADTHGFEVNTERPNAWPYRDYVIRALNEDRPYDRFVREQIAGDALGEDAATGFLVTASVLLPGQIGKDEVSIRLARQDALDEIVVNVTQTFLGLSVGCARCHDHKSDPISQEDYYAMQAMVAGVEYEDRPIRTAEAEERRRQVGPMRDRVRVIAEELSRHAPLARPRSGARNRQPGEANAEANKISVTPPAGDAPVRPTVNARANTDRWTPVRARRLRFFVQATNSLEPCVDELEVFSVDGRNVALAASGATLRTSGDTLVADRHAPSFVHDGRYGNESSWMSNLPGGGWIEVTFPMPEVITRVVWSRDRNGTYEDRLPTEYHIEIESDDGGGWQVVADSTDRRPWVAGTDPGPAFTTAGLSTEEAGRVQQWIEEKGLLEARIKTAEAGELVFGGKFRPPDRIRLLHRGDPEQPQQDVPPATLRAIGRRALATEAPEQERRRALADWIASPANPLTARVIVNRIWQGHFGIGLVETSSDFGRAGTRPTHPDLLDWLAADFIRGGWSMKRLHRLIVLSATYRQRTSEVVSSDAGPGHPRQSDAEARWLWRFPSRRLEAEAIRDSMLAVSGRLDFRQYGRGFDLFDQRGGLSGFKPVETPSGDGLRRMIYAHKVRREREAVFGAFDCPDAGQSTARRRESTTPLQALNLFNSRFTLDASDALAARARVEAGPDIGNQLVHVWRLALGRPPVAEELDDARPVAEAHGVAAVCRALYNSNEFVLMP